MALDKFQPYLFVSAGEQSNKYLTPVITNGIAQFQAQRVQDLTGLKVRIDPIQEGSGDPSPTNIRPISGRTGMTVTRAGKNLLAPWVTTATTVNGVTYTPNGDGTFTSRGTATSGAQINSPRFKLPAGNYTLSGCPSGGGGSTYYLRALLYNGSTLVRILGSDYGAGASFTIAESETDYEIMIITNVITNNTAPTAAWKPQLEIGAIATAYTPYVAPTEIPITWETEAGTIYGGTLDVVSGVLTVDRFCKAFDGTETGWTKAGGTSNNTQRYYILWENMGVSGGVLNPSDALCSHLVFLTGNAGQFGTFNSTVTNFAVKDGDGSQFADINAFKAWLAAQNTNGTPLQLCVELATPQTYNITPEDIKTLAGFNQIYSDAGPVIDIKF